MSADGEQGGVTERPPLIAMAAALNAAISLLEAGGKKAASSDKMFEQMLCDYRAALARGLAALAKHPTSPEDAA